MTVRSAPEVQKMQNEKSVPAVRLKMLWKKKRVDMKTNLAASS